MQKKEKKYRVYTAEFKLQVVVTMREEQLSYHETVRRFKLGDPNAGSTRKNVKRWERIYILEGAEGLAKERRGRRAKGNEIPKLSKEMEEDLIAENQRLRLENDYLKKLQALALSKIESEKKTKPE